MAINYTRFQTLALDQITANGKAITHKVYTGGAFDPVLGRNATVTYTSVTGVYALEVGMNAIINSSGITKAIEGTRVQRNDRRLLCVGLTSEPVVGKDKITLEGEDKLVIDCSPLEPASTVIFYNVVVRG